MKKLLVLAAVVCAAVIAQASAFKWTISGTSKVYQAGTSTLLGSGTLYLFDAGSVAQAALLDTFVTKGTFDTSKAVANANVSSGSISATEFSDGNDGDSHQYYMALVNGSDIFVSGATSAAGQASKTTPVAVKGAGSKNAVAEWTAGSTFASGGWYKAGATPTPEPTSAMLLLLGMAGLALRRRRA